MPTRDETRPVTLKAALAQVEAWEEAAAAAGMSRQAWCMAILDCAAGRSALPEQIRRLTRGK
jgi:hypothetical protein